MIKITKTIFAMAIFLFSIKSFAGGVGIFVSINEISTNNIPYTINFKILDNKSVHRFLTNCKNVSFILTPKGKPWWNRLPFMNSARPSLDEINEAIDFLKESKKQKLKIIIIPMGDMLKNPANNNCSFKIDSMALGESFGNSYIELFDNYY